MLWYDFLDFIKANGLKILILIAFVLILFVLIRYIKLIGLFRSCRKLAKLYNGKLEKTHPLCLRIFGKCKEADVKISFDDKELYVMFIRIKPKTTVRFVDANTIEKIRYRKAIVPAGNNKGLFPSASAAITYGQGSEVTPKYSKTQFDFKDDSDAVRLILFTENPSGIFVFNSSRKNYDIIGDGEVAYSYHVGGRSFIKKWIERNN